LRFSDTKAQFVQCTDITGGSIKALAASGSVVFAGSDESTELKKSTDYGVTWTLAASFNQNISCLTFIGTDLYCGGYSGAFKSTDMGNTWTTYSFSNSRFNDFASGNSKIYAASALGVYISSDNGVTFALSNSGLPSSNQYISKLLIVGSKIYAATNAGVYASTDGGATWSASGTGISDKIVNTLATDGTLLYAGTNDGIYSSSDSGANWSLSGYYAFYINAFLTYNSKIYAANSSTGTVDAKDFNSVTWPNTAAKTLNASPHCFASSGSYIFTGTWGAGIYRSSDNGATWTQMNKGINYTTITSVISSGTYAYAGTLGNGIFRSSDNGVSWQQSNKGLEYFFINNLYCDGSNIYAATNLGLYKSADNGNNWSRISNNLIYYITGNGSKLFIATTINGWNAGVYVSTDNGTTWNPANAGISNAAINFLLINGTSLYAYSADGKFYLSTDDGASWNQLTGFPGGLYVKSINGMGTSIFVGTLSNYIYTSSNNGSSFTQMPHSETNSNFYSLLGYNYTLYAGSSSSKLYRTNNMGATWSEIGSGIAPNQFIYALGQNNSYLFAGTYSSGLWRRPISEVTLGVENNSVPESFILGQNYPNPFNPTTVISYQVPAYSHVTISVYDVLGKEVIKLVDEEKSQGNYKVNFNARNLPSGVYFYRIISGAYTQTNKMMLIK
jgi:photosystem II stability/assembly factor-like uncharacterized protein